MKADKLDFAVFLIVTLCLLGVAAGAFLGDPARQPRRVGYLYPASGALQNVWQADIHNPGAQEQLTFSDYGVYDFDFSHDGRWLAFADRSASGSVTLRLLELPTRQLRDLLDCVAADAYCTTPVFSPDGKWLAYQRSEASGVSYGIARIWLIDMSSIGYETQPLIADSQVVGHSPVWSGDSQTVAFYSGDRLQPGILVYDLFPREEDAAQLRFIPTSHGTMGTLSPDGRRLIFPEVARRGEQFFTHLQLADLANKEFAAYTDPQGPTDDGGAQWSPDGALVAFSRRYLDERWTPGSQLYLRPLGGGEQDLTPVAYDPRYNSSYARWNAASDMLVMQRFPLLDESGVSNPRAAPEVWAHDLATGASWRISQDAYLPQWVAG